MSAGTLAGILAELPASWRQRVSAITLETDDGVMWRARLLYAMWTEGPGLADVGPYTVSVDRNALPAGVTVRVAQRVPDTVHPLGPLSADGIKRAIEQLTASGLVGGLDWSRRPSGAWLIKTHAGSDAERRAWVRSL
jgi:hypothetical protein